MNKLELMQLTEFENADSAIPEPWLEEMEKTGFDRHDLLVSIAWSYRKSSWGAPVILPLELLRKMEVTYVTVNMGNCHANMSISDLVMKLIKYERNYEVRLETNQKRKEHDRSS